MKNPEILQEIENDIFRDTVSVLRQQLRFMSRNICSMCEVCAEARGQDFAILL
jgi:NADH:ubiquinone oxidoreductase subunit F (NADH-binding)